MTRKVSSKLKSIFYESTIVSPQFSETSFQERTTPSYLLSADLSKYRTFHSMMGRQKLGAHFFMRKYLLRSTGWFQCTQLSPKTRNSQWLIYKKCSLQSIPVRRAIHRTSPERMRRQQSASQSRSLGQHSTVSPTR